MEPLAVAGYVAIAAAAVFALILGAVAGAIAWVLKGRLLLLGLLAASVYFAEQVFLGSSRVLSSAIIGMPPLILALLVSWLTAYYLDARWKLRRIPAALSALGCALVVGFGWGFLFRLDLWVPIWVAVVADLCLIAVFYRRIHA